MEILLGAHDAVGGDIVSGGGTGTCDVNDGARSCRRARTC